MLGYHHVTHTASPVCFHLGLNILPCVSGPCFTWVLKGPITHDFHLEQYNIARQVLWKRWRYFWILRPRKQPICQPGSVCPGQVFLNTNEITATLLPSTHQIGLSYTFPTHSRTFTGSPQTVRYLMLARGKKDKLRCSGPVTCGSIFCGFSYGWSTVVQKY